MSWVGINRISVDSPTQAERILEAFRHRTGEVDRQPGFLKFELWREERHTEIMVVTHWQRKEDFLAWVNGPAYQQAHLRADRAPGTAHPSLYEIVG